MSPRELAWRLGAPAAARLRERRRHALPDWSYEPWLASLRELVGTRGNAFAADAARVAAGELELWGRPVASRPGSIDWDVNPLSGRGWSEHGPRSGLDAKPIWELHRQQHLLPLAAGAVAAGRPEWGSLCIEDVAAWIAANPRDTGAPGWSSAYETSHRLVGWGVAIPLVSTVCDVPSSFATAYGEQARFVAARTSRYSSANNHRIVELTGSSAGALLTHDRAELVRLADELSQAARNQTFSDGGSREQAAGYFLYVLETLWFAGLVLRAGNVDLSRLREVVLRMLDWLDAVADAAGEPPPVGDDAEDRILRVEYYEPRRAASLASRARELFSEASGPSRGRRAPASRLLADSGYAVFREPARTRIVFDVGDLGFGRLAAHGHADALAVLVDIAGVPMAWDSGTYTYAAADGRDRFRITAAHNTVEIGGRSQAQPLGPHLWGRPFRTTLEAAVLCDELDYVRASVQGFGGRRERAVHTRAVTFVRPDLLVVVDRVSARTAVDAVLRWHLARDAPLAVASQPQAVCSARLSPHSARYTWLEDAPVLEWQTRASTVFFASVLALEGDVEPVFSLSIDRGSSVVEVESPRSTRVVEDWRSHIPQMGQ